MYPPHRIKLPFNVESPHCEVRGPRDIGRVILAAEEFYRVWPDRSARPVELRCIPRPTACHALLRSGCTGPPSPVWVISRPFAMRKPRLLSHQCDKRRITHSRHEVRLESFLFCRPIAQLSPNNMLRPVPPIEIPANDGHQGSAAASCDYVITNADRLPYLVE